MGLKELRSELKKRGIDGDELEELMKTAGESELNGKDYSPDKKTILLAAKLKRERTKELGEVDK
jgi:hypothetical protein